MKLTKDPNHSIDDRNDLTNDIVLLHFNQLMFFIKQSNEQYMERRAQEIIIARTKNLKEKLILKKEAVQNQDDYIFENVCGDCKYLDSINYITKSSDLEDRVPEEVKTATCKQFFHKRKERVRLNSKISTEGSLEHIFKRSKTSFLDSSSSV